MERAIGKINFLRRSIISILVGSFVLVAGVALYLELNIGTRFLVIVLGFSTPFFFIGSLLLRWHYANRKKIQNSITNNLTEPELRIKLRRRLLVKRF
jgi:hypothetical protein